MKQNIKSFLPEGSYVQEIFDPIQTHAIYGINLNQLNELKIKLKNIGCNRFRKVKATGKGLFILCFKDKDGVVDN